MSRRHMFHHGTPAEQAAYARDEVSDARVDDSVMLDAYDVQDQSERPQNGEQQQTYDGHTSRGSGMEASEENSDPGLLFSMLQEALPKQAEQGKQNQNVVEQQEKRNQAEHTWERVRRWLWANPQLETRRAAAYVRGQADACALHLMCKLYNPPEDVVLAIVEAAPETASWTDSHGWLPLHHACANGASPEVIKILIDAYPEGKVQQDNQSRTPLHFYATRNSDNPNTMTLNAEMLSDTGAAQLTDRGGMLPMHYACAYGSHPAVLKVLAEVYPESLAAKEGNGRTPMHLAMVNAHRDTSPPTIRFLLSYPESKESINTRDNDGYRPLHLLALALKGYRADDTEKRANVSESLALYLAAEPTPTADFLTAIQDLPDWLQDTAVVSKHVHNVLNEKIIMRFPTSILMLDGYLLIALIVCFAIASKNHIDLRFDPENTTNDSQVALIIVIVSAIYFLLRELVQIASLISLGSFNSWWKKTWLDTAIIVLVIYYAVHMIDPSMVVISNEAFRAGVAFTQGLLWVKFIIFLKKTLVDFAVFVGGVLYVVQRLAAFLLAVCVILLAFAEMFYFVYVDTNICNFEPRTDLGEEECRFPHCTFTESLLKVYTMMMGEIGDETRYSTNLVAQILYVFYAFIVVILLSNVLIAIVTDSYEIIQNDRAAIVFWNNRLDFVAEMDAISYNVSKRIHCCGSDKKGDSDKDAIVEVQEGSPGGQQDQIAEPEMQVSDDLGGEESSDIFRESWHQVMLLFDANLYDEIDWVEMWVYHIFRILCIFLVIPLWLTIGAATCGWLWPPQVREYMFVQKETAISRAELERQKLEQLKDIQADLKNLKHDIMREMAADREDIMRMRTEVETVQSEVLSDLHQVRELMTSLLRQ